VLDAASASSGRQAAARFNVGVATAISWMATVTATGTVAARPQGRPRTSKHDAHETFLRDLLDEQADITLGEMRARLPDGRDVSWGSARCGTDELVWPYYLFVACLLWRRWRDWLSGRRGR